MHQHYENIIRKIITFYMSKQTFWSKSYTIVSTRRKKNIVLIIFQNLTSKEVRVIKAKKLPLVGTAEDMELNLVSTLVLWRRDLRKNFPNINPIGIKRGEGRKYYSH